MLPFRGFLPPRLGPRPFIRVRERGKGKGGRRKERGGQGWGEWMGV